jgi:hypothetical protein
MVSVTVLSEDVGWIYLALDRVLWRAFVNTLFIILVIKGVQYLI